MQDNRIDSAYLFSVHRIDRAFQLDTVLDMQANSVPLCDVVKILKASDTGNAVLLYEGSTSKGEHKSFIVRELEHKAILLPANGGFIGQTKCESQIIVENVCSYPKDPTAKYCELVSFDYDGEELKRVAMNRYPLLTREEEIAQNYNGIIDNAFAYSIFSINNRMIPYRIAELYPEQVDEKAILVIFLHGGDGIGNDNKRQVGPNILPPRDWYKYLAHEYKRAIIIAPQMANRWINYKHELKALIDQIIRDKDVDPRRVYICGTSLGGLGTWQMILEYPDFFAAALPAASNTLLDTPAQLYKAKLTPICSITGRFEPDATQKFNNLRNLGGDVKYSHYPQYNHGEACGYSCSQENIKWMLSHVRSAE